MKQEFGAAPSEIKISAGRALAVMEQETENKEHSHGITLDMMKQIPAAINNPVFILKSATRGDSLVVYTDIKDANGRATLIPVRLNKDGSTNITSIYGRDNEEAFLIKQAVAGNIFYANSKKSLALLRHVSATIVSYVNKEKLFTGTKYSTEN